MLNKYRTHKETTDGISSERVDEKLKEEDAEGTYR